MLLAEPEEHDYALHRFNELWEQSVDVKDVHDTIINIVEKESPFAFLSPYDLYLKFLSQYFRDYLGDRTKLNTENLPQNFRKLQYQEDAVFTAQQMLKSYGGLFIADVVGLGKTYMSALLALQLDGRCLVIAPPSLLDENSPGSWPRVFRDFCISGHKCASLGKLEEVIEHGVEFYRYVFIDESHRFKGDSTQRYELLTRICQGKGVILVSATPSQGSCVQSNGTVSCNIGSVASALGFEVSIVVTPTMAGTITNSFNVTANEADPVPANNSATLTTTVAPTSKLTVTRTGTGSGTVTVLSDLYGVSDCPNGCTATYVTGTVFTATETPNGNSFFNGWSGACNGSGAYAVIMYANKGLAANFVLGENLSVAFAGTGSGSITSKDGAINCANSAGNCSASYLPGTSVSLTAAPAGTSVFAGWSGACSGTDPNVCSVTMNSVQSVTATFNPPPDFILAPATTTFTTQAGAQVTDVLTLTGQNGFAGAVTLTCAVTGPAPLPTCKVSLSPVMLSSSPGSSTLTITAPATLAAFALPRNEGNHAAFALDISFCAMVLGGIGLWLGDFKKRRRLSLLLGGVIILFAVLAGCATGSSTSGPTPQNYTVTVNATSGSLQHSTTVTLTVQ